MVDITSSGQVTQLLNALGEQIASAGRHYGLVVVGGSALFALGIISRPTKDVDVIAFVDAGAMAKADPLPQELIAARDRVGRDFALPAEWLNSGPAGSWITGSRTVLSIVSRLGVSALVPLFTSRRASIRSISS
jgi:hypothetical protein